MTPDPGEPDPSVSDDATRDDRRFIDVHHHFLPPGYVSAVGADVIGAPAPAGKVPHWSPTISIDAMDRNGIGKAILSISAPGIFFGDPEAARDIAAVCNGHAAEVCAAHPDRFGFFVATPLPEVGAALAEIDRALEGPHVSGIGLLTTYGPHYLGDEIFRPFFDELDRRAATVYVHPTNAPCCGTAGVLGTIPAATLDFPFETTRTIVSLLYGGTFARCRNIRWIFSHAGGTLPFLADRIARLARFPRYAELVPNGPLAELQRLHFDTALSANRRSLQCLLDLVAPSQVLFGSDFPFAPEATMTQSVQGIRDMAFPDEIARAIEFENATRILA